MNQLMKISHFNLILLLSIFQQGLSAQFDIYLDDNIVFWVEEDCLDSPVQFSPSVICDECNEDELFQWEVLVDLYGD